MEDNPKLWEVMQAFHSLSGAVAFTANEIALFYALLYSWNAARRPAVLQQWANTSCANSALGKHTFPDARNGLIQKGVIFFSKAGNRGVPRYSLNAVVNLPNPLIQPLNGSNSGSNSGSKPGVTAGVNPDSYQSNEKGNEHDPPQPPKGGDEGDVEPEEEKPKKKRPKKPPFQPPTKEEFISYLIEAMPGINPEWTEERTRRAAANQFDTYEDNGWKDGNGKPVKTWKTKARNCLKHQKPWSFGTKKPPRTGTLNNGQLFPARPENKSKIDPATVNY